MKNNKLFLFSFLVVSFLFILLSAWTSVIINQQTTLIKAHSEKYLEKDGSERIEVFQKKLSGDKASDEESDEESDKKQRMKLSQDLTNLFLQLMWSGINMVALDTSGSRLLQTEANLAYPSKPKEINKKTMLPVYKGEKVSDSLRTKRINNGEIPWKPHRLSFIFPRVKDGNKSSCTNTNSNIWYAERCLGFSEKSIKNGFYNRAFWKSSSNEFFTFSPKLTNVKIDTVPWWFYASNKNIANLGGGYSVTVLRVDFLVEALWNQFTNSGKNFSDWKIDFTKLTGKPRQQILNLIDGEGNLRSGIQENILTHIEKRWGKLDFLTNNALLLEKVKIFGFKNLFYFLNYGSDLKESNVASYSQWIKKMISIFSDPFLNTLQKIAGFDFDSNTFYLQMESYTLKNNSRFITIQTGNKRVNVFSLIKSSKKKVSDLSLEQLKILQKVKKYLTLPKLKTQLLSFYKTKIQPNLRTFASHKITKVKVEGKLYQVDHLTKFQNIDSEASRLTDKAKVQLSNLFQNAITKTQLDVALTTVLATQEAQKAEATKNQGLIIGLSVGGSALALSSFGGFLYWFFKIKK